MGGTCHPWVASTPTHEGEDLGGFRGGGRSRIVAATAPSVGVLESGAISVGVGSKPARRARLGPRGGHGWQRVASETRFVRSGVVSEKVAEIES